MEVLCNTFGYLSVLTKIFSKSFYIIQKKNVNLQPL